MSSDPRPARISRAAEIAAAWVGRPGMIGAYLTGSATRAYADDNSDLDIVIVGEDDAVAAIHPDRRYKMGIDRGPPRRKAYDLLVLAWTTLAQLRTSDLDHYRQPFQHVVMLHDAAGRIAGLVREIAALPREIRDERMRVHCYEYLWGQTRAARCVARGDLVNARMVAAASLIAAAKCMFLAQDAWPAKLQWSSHELREAGVPEELVTRFEHAWLHLDGASDLALQQMFLDWLTAKGFTFHRYTVELTNWAVTDPAGIAAVHRWARTH